MSRDRARPRRTQVGKDGWWLGATGRLCVRPRRPDLSGRQPVLFNEFMTQQEHRADLVRSAQEGDKGAFGRLYELTRPELRAYVRGRLRGTSCDSELSADVVSETYLRAYRRLGLFDPERPVMPWLIVIARNILHDHFKSSRAQRELPMELVDDELPDLFAPDPHESAEYAERWAQAVRSVNALTTKQRNALLYRYYLGYSCTETARRLQTTPAAVRVAAFYGVSNVRKARDRAGGWCE